MPGKVMAVEASTVSMAIVLEPSRSPKVIGVLFF